MRMLFSTIGSRGDVQPLVALALHLKALSHDVRVCVPPDFRNWIESLGIEVTAIGQSWLAADATLGPWPDPTDRGVFQTGAWILPDERALSRNLEAFLQGGDPPVYFGFGSSRASEDAGPVILHAARALGRRAIVSQGWFDDSFVANERDCLSIGEVNVHALFPRVAAIVHHGGAGTTTAAALAGTPQVVIPSRYDQHYWAQRVRSLGIGTAHVAAAPTRDSLTSALVQSLRPEVAERALEVAGAVRQDGTRVAAERLVALA